MGRRRRSQKKVNSKKKATVSKVFKCPFCSMENAVACKIDLAKARGTLNCRVCQAKYESRNINYLTEPIDVFCEWVDELDELNAREGGHQQEHETVQVHQEVSDEDEDDED